ncbi:phosphoenolpyruvate carboxykinase (ATP) [Bdellovibrio sp. HCB337]|uniref:phosphoenolpyruvate carboxykinase (ATP) n=1 Tax=Bdellovibrio sp. HCB337 TaxID=3394358 RepID=UPI0039A4107A
MSLINDLNQFKITHKIDGWDLRPPIHINGEAIDDTSPVALDIRPVIFKNCHKSFLMQKALSKKQAELGPHGELIVATGSHTGRAADDKYVVHTETTEKTIWWENNLKPMGEEVFDRLYQDILAYLYELPELFLTHRSIGKANHYALNIEFLSEMPAAALFTQYMFKSKQAFAHEDFKIIHAPFFEVDPFKYGTRSDTVIATSFDKKCVIIAGTQYAGEIKKSMFSVMNYLAPEQGILPMHAGANQNSDGECFAFFGLSGTGKTTLSTDQGTSLIGDDEHGISDRGLFNFEGGCYAKTHRLSAANEPDIYKACTRFGSYLENVKFDHDNREVDFYDASITENGRASYPLEFIEDRVSIGEGKVPKDIFFLTADAFGVLPPISSLTLQQAVDYFILGYTAKVAGTEMGVKAPKATFSPCFGAPFMLRHPMEYAELFANYAKKYDIRIWLVNTGWYGGPYGKGERFPINITREIVRAIQNHEVLEEDLQEEPVFGLRIPNQVRDIPSRFLNPAKAWPSEADYLKAARNLQASFELQLGKFRH